ncbi:MAG TPA: protease pro-enzyme activation domain-containing protein, partial [Ktedonosporobacter sp.]|nr:protease pro-enzyme activation domain-containing protein [Ktedonosporobacter sp.]
MILLNVVFALIMLTGCNMLGNAAPPPTPTPEPIQLTTLDLGLPQKALDAPIVGTVPDDQVLHVNVTLKVDQATLNQLGNNGASLPSGQNAVATADLSKKLGISDDKLKQIQSYFGLEHIDVKPNKTRTNLTFDAKAGPVARLLGTKFVIHKLDNRQYFTPDPKQMPKVPPQIASYILAITGLDNYSLPPAKKGTQAMQHFVSQRTSDQNNADCVNFNQYPTAASAAKLAH